VSCDGVLISCVVVTVTSARTIEHPGGILEDIRDTDLGTVRRYWIALDEGTAPRRATSTLVVNS
jgi:predicted acetyltransferase